MAAVFVIRALIYLSPSAYKLVKIEQQASGQPGPQDLGRWAWELIYSDASDQEVADALTSSSGTLHSVETITEPFELRKAQVRWGRASGAAAGTDDAVTTHHFLRVIAGQPSDTWTAADFQAVEGRLLTLANVLNDYWTPSFSYKQVRWYKAGPAIVPPQAPVRIIDPALAGTAVVGGDMSPPQVAVSVTEKTPDPKSWGRFYLPAMIPGIANTYGRIDAGFQGALADACDAMYEGFVTDGTPAVVYSAAKPARPTAGGGSLAAVPARALPVRQVQVDDLFDVIRSRRYNEPLLRLQRDIAGS